MFGAVRHAIGRTALPIAERLSSDSWVHHPRPPEGRRVVRAPGPHADRALLIGNSLAVGWGSIAHEVALAGRLARATAALTAHGVDVEVDAGRSRSTTTAIERLTRDSIGRYDAVVLMLGAREALQMMPIAMWVQGMTQLLDHISALAESPPPVLVVAAEEITPVPLPPTADRAAISRIRAINAATRDLVSAHEGVSFVSSGITSPRGTGQEFARADTSWLYARAAATLAPALARALSTAKFTDSSLDEAGRLAATAHVRARLAERDAALTRLVTSTRDLFGAIDAALLLVESDDIEPIVSSPLLIRVPREQSFSMHTIRHRRGFVVTDVLADERFNRRDDVVGPPFLRAYAGHPVESPDGHPVAVLALGFARARDFTPTDLTLLRALAQRAGELLFRPVRR